LGRVYNQTIKKSDPDEGKTIRIQTTDSLPSVLSRNTRPALTSQFRLTSIEQGGS
jgi:hypothetical protein